MRSTPPQSKAPWRVDDSTATPLTDYHTKKNPMHHTPIPTIPDAPPSIRSLARGRSIHDTSSSPEARVYALDAEGASSNALFAKTAAAGTLAHEARMSTAFHELGLGPEVVEYLPGGGTHADWLVTRAVIGRFDAQFCPRTTAADAHRVATEAAGELRTDALLHGDYCLPNVILDDWRFSGFIDLDHAGLSDRHIDVFWGSWTLWFNLHTSAYCNRFLDAYGRDVIDEGKLAAIAAMECFM